MNNVQIYFDGMLWIVRLGEDDETAIIGTGETVIEAIVNFDKAFSSRPTRRR